MSEEFDRSHRVPSGGLPAWNQPDGAQPVAAMLEPGHEVRVLERLGEAWTRVEFSNGWTAWVDGRQLVAAVPLGAGTPRRWPLVASLVVVAFLIPVVAFALVRARSNEVAVGTTNESHFSGRLPPVVVATVTSGSSSSTTSSATTTTTTTTSNSSQNQSTPTTQPTPTTDTTPQTQPPPPTQPQCFVPGQISITLSDGSSPKVGVSGDGSSRTFTFDFGPNALSADATINGLTECGSHYQMDFTASGGSGFVCGKPPTLSATFQTGTPQDRGTIVVRPVGASC